MTPPYEANSGPGAYRPRTISNAQESDLTISVANDFSTGGEYLTERAARGAARPYRGVNKNGNPTWLAEYGNDGQFGRVTSYQRLNHMDSNLDDVVASMVTDLNAVAVREGRPVVINGAGNGLGRIKTQDEADAYARHIIDRIMSHPDRQFEIARVVTGGQNGYDVAFAKAAKAYGIDVKINPAYTSRGSIMLQEPGNPEGMIFMSRQQYIRNYQLDTGNVGMLGS
jgi:hypothetical protein